jgi:ATP synthase protein I
MNEGRGTGEPGRGGISGAEFGAIGLQFAATIVVFAFIGIWLDRRLGTSPWMLLICVFVGAGGGFYSMYRLVTRRAAKGASERKDDSERRS